MIEETVIGIDPGLTGAVTLLNQDGQLVMTWDPPTIVRELKPKPGGKVRMRRDFDVRGMVSILKEVADGNSIVFIEKSQTMPEQGVVGAFNYGVGYGIWIGIINALGMQIHHVHPKTWRNLVMRDCGKDKGSSVLRAKQLFPNIDITMKKHHGRAESALIAYYGHHFLRHTF